MIRVFSLLTLVPVLAIGATPASNATRDANRLVSCMKAFDADCVASVTYIKFMEDMGAPKAELIKAARELNKSLQSIGARYSEFVLKDPSAEFSGDGRTYVFIPYRQVMEVPGRVSMRQEAYFIGVSEDNGAHWQFVDGWGATPDNIRAIIPSYRGQPLPPKSRSPITK